MKRPFYTKFKFIENTEEFEQGETIENKVRRMVDNKEPISDGAPLIYTEKSKGVIAAYNIRTDKWEIAQDAMNKAYMSDIAKAKNANAKVDEGGNTTTSNKDNGNAQVSQGE